MSRHDLVTFACEGMEQNPAVDDLLLEGEAMGWLEAFPNGELKRDISVLIGRDAFELLVAYEHRADMVHSMKELHYVLIEGE